MRRSQLLQFVATALVILPTAKLLLQDEFEREPIQYSESTPDNCISRLQQLLEDGEVTLTCDGDKSYLPSLLIALNVPVESQMA